MSFFRFDHVRAPQDEGVRFSAAQWAASSLPIHQRPVGGPGPLEGNGPMIGSAPNSPRPLRMGPRANSIAAPDGLNELLAEEEEDLPAPNVYRPGLWHDDIVEEDDVEAEIEDVEAEVDVEVEMDEGMVDDDMVEDDSDIVIYPLHPPPAPENDEGFDRN